MKIMLACAAGMSTSMLMKKLEKYAAENGIEGFAIDAIPAQELTSDQAGKFDVVLLGPQVSYLEKTVVKKINGVVPVAIIPMKDYGRSNCEAIIQLAKDTIGA